MSNNPYPTNEELAQEELAHKVARDHAKRLADIRLKCAELKELYRGLELRAGTIETADHAIEIIDMYLMVENPDAIEADIEEEAADWAEQNS